MNMKILAVLLGAIFLCAASSGSYAQSKYPQDGKTLDAANYPVLSLLLPAPAPKNMSPRVGNSLQEVRACGRGQYECNCYGTLSACCYNNWYCGCNGELPYCSKYPPQ